MLRPFLAAFGLIGLFVGPVILAILLATGGNHRVAILCTSLFFAAGLWLLRRLQVQSM